MTSHPFKKRIMETVQSEVANIGQRAREVTALAVASVLNAFNFMAKGARAAICCGAPLGIAAIIIAFANCILALIGLMFYFFPEENIFNKVCYHVAGDYQEECKGVMDRYVVLSTAWVLLNTFTLSVALVRIFDSTKKELKKREKGMKIMRVWLVLAFTHGLAETAFNIWPASLRYPQINYTLYWRHQPAS